MCAGISSHKHGYLDANKNKEYHALLAFYSVLNTRKVHWGTVRGTKLKTHPSLLNFLTISGAVPPLLVLYGCETWSLTLREERRLRVFENMVLRRVFGPKRDEVTGELRKLHYEGLSDLYSLPNIVRVVKS
jgi:hypothetical protein